MEARRWWVHGLVAGAVVAGIGWSYADNAGGFFSGRDRPGPARESIEAQSLRPVTGPVLVALQGAAARGGDAQAVPLPDAVAASAAQPSHAHAAAQPSPASAQAAAKPRGTGGNGPRRRSPAPAFVPVPLQATIDRVQPMTGIVLWNDNTTGLAALGDDVQLEFAYLRYSDVVNDQDVYDWSAVDARLASAAARGHQMILRFHDTYPGQTAITIPAYVANAPGYALDFRSVEGQQTFIPDWRSTLLQQFVLQFFTRFAERYDHDPRLAFLQVGFGSYAEYHLWDGPLTLGRTFPSKDYQRQFLEHLGATFAQTPWSLSIDAASATYSPFAEVAALRQLRFGLFDDSFMHESHSENDQEYNRSSWLFFGEQRHRDSPAGGEFNYFSPEDQRHVLDYPNGFHGRGFESFAAQYRISYMIGNDQPGYQTRARIRQAAMATGYAFRITALSSNGDCVRMTVRNEGIAPIYHDAWPAANGRRADTSLKGLATGAEREFQACIGPHQASALAITIESDRLVPGQRIQFNADLR